MDKVMLVASGKGGTGKTFFASNAGAILAERGNRVLLIDMDMGLRSLDISLGLENKVIYDIVDVVTGVCKIKQAIIKDRNFNGLYLMSASQNRDKGEINNENMIELCEKLRTKFDYIIIDCPSGIGTGLALASSVASKGIIITVPEYAAIRDADILDRTLADMGVTDRRYIVNKINFDMMEGGLIPNLDQISQILRAKIAGTIQYDNNIHIAMNNGMPIVSKKETYIEKNFNSIIDRIVD
jgi:septum site-determining protein MinD